MAYQVLASHMKVKAGFAMIYFSYFLNNNENQVLFVEFWVYYDKYVFKNSQISLFSLLVYFDILQTRTAS